MRSLTTAFIAFIGAKRLLRPYVIDAIDAIVAIIAVVAFIATLPGR